MESGTREQASHQHSFNLGKSMSLEQDMLRIYEEITGFTPRELEHHTETDLPIALVNSVNPWVPDPEEYLPTFRVVTVRSALALERTLTTYVRDGWTYDQVIGNHGEFTIIFSKNDHD